MSRGNASGVRLTRADIPLVLGMQARGDRDHDIAAWFGVNQGRIAEAKDGRYSHITPAPTQALPPKGPPGLKGRVLRESLQEAIDHLNKTSGHPKLKGILDKAAREYDRNER